MIRQKLGKQLFAGNMSGLFCKGIEGWFTFNKKLLRQLPVFVLLKKPNGYSGVPP